MIRWRHFLGTCSELQEFGWESPTYQPEELSPREQPGQIQCSRKLRVFDGTSQALTVSSIAICASLSG